MIRSAAPQPVQIVQIVRSDRHSVAVSPCAESKRRTEPGRSQPETGRSSPRTDAARTIEHRGPLVEPGRTGRSGRIAGDPYTGRLPTPAALYLWSAPYRLPRMPPARREQRALRGLMPGDRSARRLVAERLHEALSPHVINRTLSPLTRPLTEEN